MPQTTSQSLLCALRNTGFFTDARMAEIEREFYSQDDPKTLAAQLVRTGELTSWQAKFLLSGRSSLRMGKYILRERLSQDKLGDRILAVHERLSRQVDLQILPAEASEESPDFQAFLRHASDVARLDHPNLIHVYDIDREGGRYYLVSEHFEAQTLHQISKTNTAWNILAAASMARQVIAGLAYAHAENVVHGNIDGRAVLLAADGTAKIGNLAIAALSRVIGQQQNENAEETPDSNPTDDFPRLAKVLLDFIDVHCQNTAIAERKKLSAIIAPLTQVADEGGMASVISALDQWLEDHRAPEIAVKKAPSALEPTRAIQDDRAATPKSPTGRATAAASARARRKIPFLKILPLISSALLIALLGWRWFAATRPSKSTAKATSDRKSESGRSGSTKKQSGKSKDQQSFSNRTGPPGTLGGLPEKEASSNSPSKSKTLTKSSNSKASKSSIAKPVAPVADSSKPSDRDAKQPEEKTKPAEGNLALAGAEATGNDPLTEPSREIPDVSTTDSKSNEMPSTQADSADIKPDLSPDEKPNEAEKTTANDETDKPSKSAEKTKPKTSDKPFAETSIAVTLPDTGDLAEAFLAKVNPGEKYLLACSLEVSDAVTRRTKFSLEKQPGDESQAWDVIGKTSSGDPTNIAVLKYVGGELKFQWLPNAVRDPSYSFLRNCLLNLEARGESFAVRLREPVKMGEANINADEPQSTLAFEIDGFPFESNAAAADFIKIDGLKFSGDDEDFSLIVEPSDQRFPARDPLFVHLTEKQERFLFLCMEAKLAKKCEIETTLRILQEPKPKPYSEKLFTELSTFYRNRAQQISQTYAEAKAYVAPEGSKTKHKDLVKQLQAQVTAANQMVSDLDVQKRRATAIFSKPIRFRIFYRIGDTDVDLATWDGKPHPSK
jgi:serine/threonine protein kinase